MSNTKPAEYVKPFYDRTSEHDSPHGSDMDRAYRQQTDALIWRCSGSTRTWTWGYAGQEDSARHGAPMASLSAVDTWTHFQLGGENIGLPWLFTASHERILSYVWLACDADVSLQVRIDGETLLDSVSTATGEVPGVRPRAKFSPDTFQLWNRSVRSGGRLGMSQWYAWLTPNVPSNRRIKLVPYVQAPTQYHEPDIRWDISGTVNVWLVAMAVMDVPPKNTVGW